MKRDPRVDPQPGDTISKDVPRALHGIILRDVTRAHGGFVFFKQDNGFKAIPMLVVLADWVRWAANAEVINVAE